MIGIEGLSVGEMTQLRIKARESNVHLRVVKNTLARRAFEGTDYGCMSDALQGQMVYAFSMEEPGGAARVLKDYADSNKNLVVKLIALTSRSPGMSWALACQRPWVAKLVIVEALISCVDDLLRQEYLVKRSYRESIEISDRDGRAELRFSMVRKAWRARTSYWYRDVPSISMAVKSWIL